jgi:hypothetical protein
MTIWGWIFMGVSWATILSLFVYCLVRTLRGGGKPDANGVDE